jgi:hypothetical protein
VRSTLLNLDLMAYIVGSHVGLDVGGEGHASHDGGDTSRCHLLHLRHHRGKFSLHFLYHCMSEFHSIGRERSGEIIAQPS